MKIYFLIKNCAKKFNMNVEWAQEILLGPRILPQRGAIQGGPLLRTDRYGSLHSHEKNPQIYKLLWFSHTSRPESIERFIEE